MGFEAFHGRIASSALRRVAVDWYHPCGDKRIPAWRDLDPTTMPAQLSIVWAWKYDHDVDSFTCRLAGEEINTLLGRNLRGVPMADPNTGSDYEAIFRRSKRIVSDACLMHSYGKIFAEIGRVGCGERIALPLSENGTRADGIFGATVYHLPGPSTSCNCLAESVCRQTTEFFPVD